MRPSTLALTVLSLLSFEPLHPYGMQRLIKQWGKDQVVNVGQRANLYKTIKRLHEAGLIAVRQTERDHQYPERTVYELTPAGEATGRAWLVDMLRTPRNEFPEFPAALSFVMALGPEGTVAVLQERAAAVRDRLVGLEDELMSAVDVPRVALLETEYLRAMTAAELTWIETVLEDLRTGELGWSLEDLLAASAPFRTGGDPPR